MPARWAAGDAALGAQLRLPAGPHTPTRGEPRCACGSAWRSLLLPDARRPRWRCLGCGALHRGAAPSPEEPDPPAG